MIAAVWGDSKTKLTFRRWFSGRAEAGSQAFGNGPGQSSHLSSDARRGSEPCSGSASGTSQPLTIADFVPVYLEEYCRIYNRCPDFKKQVLSRVLGWTILEADTGELPGFAKRLLESG